MHTAMTVRGWLAAAAVAGLVAGLGIVAAPPVAAATTWSEEVTADSSTDIGPGFPMDACTWGSRDDPLYSASTTFQPSADGSYTFTVISATIGGQTDGNTTALAVFTPGYGQAECVGSDFEAVGLTSLTVDLTAGTTYLLLFYGLNDENVSTGVFTVDIPEGVVLTGTSDSSPIPAWLQSYGRAGSGAACEAGWAPSWQEWAVPVTGGWVCTRSIPSLG